MTDFDEDELGNPFLVMELLEGQNLAQRLRQGGRLSLVQDPDRRERPRIGDRPQVQGRRRRAPHELADRGSAPAG